MILQTFIMLGVAVSAWQLPLLDGVNYTGWIWVSSACVLAPFLVRSPGKIWFAAGYLGFLAWATVCLRFVDGPITRLHIQNLLQLIAPLLPMLLVRCKEPGQEDASPIRLELLLGAALLIWVPEVLSWFRLGYGPNARPGAIGMCFIAAASLGRVSAGGTAAWAGVILAAAYSFHTGSRMATFVIVGLVALSALQVRSFWLRVVLVSLAIAAAVVVFQTDQFQTRFFGSGYGGTGDARQMMEGRFNTSGRFELWERLWEECWEAPIQGHGPGTSQTASSGMSQMVHPHNDYLKVFYEYGFVGLCLLLPFYVKRVWVYMRDLRMAAGYRQRACLAQGLFCLAAFAALAVTDNPILYTSHFMFPLFLVLGSADNARLAPDLEEVQPDDAERFTGNPDVVVSQS